MRYIKVKETGGGDPAVSLWRGGNMQPRRRDQSALLVLAPYMCPRQHDAKVFLI